MKDVRSVSLVDRRGYLTVVLELEGDIPGLVVRKPEGLRDWYNIVQKQVTSLTQEVTMTHLCLRWRMPRPGWCWALSSSGPRRTQARRWTPRTLSGLWTGEGCHYESRGHSPLLRRSAAGYHYSDRPASVASVDRRQQRYRHRHHRQCKRPVQIKS